MKKIQYLLAFAAIFSFAVMNTSCNKDKCCSHDAHASCSHSKDNKEESKGKEYTSAYICPMYCEGSGNTEAGECPVCHMDYVPNKNYK